MKKHTFAVVALTASLVVADESYFFRVETSSTSLLTSIGMDGVLAWSNATPGELEQLQRATLLLPADWHDYVLVPATAVVSGVKAFDLNPPPNMALIPAGSFVMGNATNVFPASEGGSDELPQHTVNLSGFYMDRFEVTRGLWDEVNAYNGGNGYSYSNSGSGKATNHPVHTVNWFDVVKWCNARSEREGLTPVYYTDAGFTTVYKTGEIAPVANWSANGYRLPTEAEWEKAARGGAADTRFPWTDFTNRISWAKANYYGWSNAYSYDLDGGSGAYHPTFATGVFPYTSPVGHFEPNGYGLYDMAGNVWEWCWDWYDGTYYANSPASDPRGPAGPRSARVLRGGSWGDDGALHARVADRDGLNPGNEYDGLFGFRCARGL